jgi:hypothetical protein
MNLWEIIKFPRKKENIGNSQEILENKIPVLSSGQIESILNTSSSSKKK